MLRFYDGCEVDGNSLEVTVVRNLSVFAALTQK